jgi:hypothetical protein
MNVNIGRMKIWDWAALGAFVLTIVGMIVPWWRFAGLGNFGGGDIGAGKAAITFAVFAAVIVLVKMLLPAGKPLPKWYMEAWPVLVFGGIMVICGLVGTVDKPGAGGLDSLGGLFGGAGDIWSWRPGGLMVLIAGLVMVFCGYMMLKDKSGDYGVATMPKINVNVIKADGSTTQIGGAAQTPPAGGASKFCVGCGTQLDAGADACKSCGKPV